MNDLYPTSALVVVAHPDDVEYYCGGTILRWVEKGCRISLIVASSGDKGIHIVNSDKEKLINLREAEQKESGKILGISDICFLRLPDAELRQATELYEKIVYHIRHAKPEVIVTHDPMVRLTRQHPDHRAVGQYVLDASFPISVMENCFPSHITDLGVSPWQADWLLMFGTDIPNYYSDITGYLEKKIHALYAHASQHSAFQGGVHERLQWRAEVIGNKYNVMHAEEFLRIRVGSASS